MASSAFVWRHCRSCLVGWNSTTTLPFVSFDRTPLWYPVSLFSTKELAPYETGTHLVQHFRKLSKEQDYSALKMEQALQKLKDSTTVLCPRSIAQLLHLFKNFSTPVPSSAVYSLVQEANKRRRDYKFDETETAMIVHSLSSFTQTLKTTPSQRSEMGRLSLQLIEDLIDCQRLLHVSNRDLIKLTYALGVMFKIEADPCDHPFSLKKCIEALSAQICQERHLVAFSQQGLKNILYAYGCLKWKSEYALLRISREIINKICGFQSSDISYMILALSRLNYFHEDLILTLSIEAVGNQHMQQFTERDLCLVLMGMQTMAAGMPSEKKMRPLLEKLFYEAGTPQRISKFNVRDVGTMLHCIATEQRDAKLSPFKKELAQRLLKRLPIMMGSKPKLDRTLCMILYNCAKMKLKNKAFLRTATSCIKDDCHELHSAWTVTLLLWALATLDTLSPVNFVSLCHRLCDLRQEGSKLTKRNWVQLTQAVQYMQQSKDMVHLDPRIKDLLEEALCYAKFPTLEFTLPQKLRAS